MTITDADVEAIADIDPTVSTDLTPFIAAAKLLLDAAVNAVDASYSDTEYDTIHTWLSAHFYHIRDNQRSSETADKVREEYQYKLGRGLECTQYGQTAKAMDYQGGLALIDDQNKKGGKKTMSVNWVGTNDSDTEDPITS
jgi:hypothetical protein